MSEERPKERYTRDANQTPGNMPAGSRGSEVDPDFVPDERRENPNEKRARKRPEETGS
ncbi:hypothetical protein ACSBOX_14300 [Arthrobacter sp. KN11-1C]|uniref:hypothetical protein n=1 Tax=Arthrobacter sp. KN11-1C TaxID=3445774 RepID=UPI003F9FF0AD